METFMIEAFSKSLVEANSLVIRLRAGNCSCADSHNF